MTPKITRRERVYEHQFSVSLPADLFRHIQHIAQVERTSRAAVVRRLVALHQQQSDAENQEARNEK